MKFSSEYIEGLTYAEYTTEGLPGVISIFHPEYGMNGMPEVDYESGHTKGSGSIKEIFLAVRLAKKAIRDYASTMGYEGKFAASPDDRDGFGNARRKIFNRYIPELVLGQNFK